MTIKRMDNVGIVVEDLDAAIGFFRELGLGLEGRAHVEGDWADGCTGLRDIRVEVAMMRTPDGHGRLELSRFLRPPVVADHRGAPVNALGYLRVMFTVEDLDDTLVRLARHGAQVVGEVVQVRDAYRLCYVRGPEGILVGLAQELAPPPAADERPLARLVGPGAVRLERDLAASVDRVWAHLADPVPRATWLAGGTIEPRVGGRVALAFRHAEITGPDDPPPAAYRAMHDEGHVARGVVTAWAPPQRLAFTWVDGAESSEVAFALDAVGDATRLRLTHRRLDTRGAVVSVAAGWDAHLHTLAAALSGAPRPAYWRTFAASEARHAAAFADAVEADGRPAGAATLQAVPGGGYRLTYERRVAAPIEAVWRTVAEADLRDRWYPAELRFEGPVGGWARERFPDDPTPLPEGTLSAWTAPHRLAFTMAADPASSEPRVRHPQDVEVVLDADGDATRLRFAHGFGDRGLAAGVGAGWHACLEALAALAEGREAVVDAAALRRFYAAWLADDEVDEEAT